MRHAALILLVVMLSGCSQVPQNPPGFHWKGSYFWDGCEGLYEDATGEDMGEVCTAFGPGDVYYNGMEQCFDTREKAERWLVEQVTRGKP